MITPLKKALLNNKTIKVASLIIGYALWSLLGQIYTANQWATIDVFYYNIPKDYVLETKPEKISIYMTGKRADLHKCTDLALYIDASKLVVGENSIFPWQEELFVPHSVKLLYYKPTKINVLVTKQESCTA